MAPRDPRSPDCSIKGCGRVAHKGVLCRKHHAMVPWSLKREMMIALWSAQSRTLTRYHRRYLLAVRAAIKGRA